MLCIPGAPQNSTALPVQNDLPAISVAEADQHLVQRQAPTYPPLAKAARVQGVVKLKLSVDPSGSVTRVFDPSGPPLLVSAAIEAAQHYRYLPFEAGGAPGSPVVEAAVSFLLSPEPPSPPIPFPAITDLSTVMVEYANGFVSPRISGTGLVEYDGSSEVAVEGKHQRYISQDEVENMLRAFRDADFFSLRDDYIAGATDVGQTRSIRVGALQKNITDDWVQVPPVLKSVQEAVLKYSHSDQWAKGTAETVPGILAELPSTASPRATLSAILPRVAYYGDIDVVRAILANGVQGLTFKGTKTGKARPVALPNSAIAVLDAHRAAQEKFRAQFGPDYRSDLDLIFSNPDGSPLRPDSISASVSALFRKLKLPKGTSLHSLRHSHGSHLPAAGLELPAVSERLGHSSVYVTATVYSHRISGRDEEAARKWEEFQRQNTPATKSVGKKLS